MGGSWSLFHGLVKEITQQFGPCVCRRCFRPGFVPKLPIFLHSQQWPVPVLLPRTQPSSPCLILQSQSGEGWRAEFKSQTPPERLCVRCCCCFHCSPRWMWIYFFNLYIPRCCGSWIWPGLVPLHLESKKFCECLTRGCSGFGAACETLLRYKCW